MILYPNNGRWSVDLFGTRKHSVFPRSLGLIPTSRGSRYYFVNSGWNCSSDDWPDTGIVHKTMSTEEAIEMYPQCRNEIQEVCSKSDPFYLDLDIKLDIPNNFPNWTIYP